MSPHPQLDWDDEHTGPLCPDHPREGLQLYCTPDTNTWIAYCQLHGLNKAPAARLNADGTLGTVGP